MQAGIEQVAHHEREVAGVHADLDAALGGERQQARDVDVRLDVGRLRPVDATARIDRLRRGNSCWSWRANVVPAVFITWMKRKDCTDRRVPRYRPGRALQSEVVAGGAVARRKRDSALGRGRREPARQAAAIRRRAGRRREVSRAYGARRAREVQRPNRCAAPGAPADGGRRRPPRPGLLPGEGRLQVLGVPVLPSIAHRLAIIDRAAVHRRHGGRASRACSSATAWS